MPLLASSKIMAFSATTDADRAKAFYRDQLGFKLVSEEQYRIGLRCGWNHAARSESERGSARRSTRRLGWNVPDIVATVEELEKAGVKFEHYGFPGQDEKGIWTPPGSTAKVAWFKDPDGNILSLTQF